MWATAQFRQGTIGPARKLVVKGTTVVEYS